MGNTIQFGRARQGAGQRWAFLITLAGWCLTLWILHGSPNMIGAGLVVAATAHWTGRDLGHAARVEAGEVILRTGRTEERVPTSEVTAIRIQPTPGWLRRSVYVCVDRGRFDSFDIFAEKAANTPEERQRLQAKVDQAIALLRSADRHE